MVRAFANLKAATANRVTFEKYGPLIEAAVNEMTSIRLKVASEQERQATQLFDQAIEEYQQASKNWEAAGKFGLPASAFVVPKWRAAREAVKQAESLLLEQTASHSQ